MTWKVKRRDSSEGTIVIVRRDRPSKLIFWKLADEEEVGRVAKDREDSVNRDRSFQDQLNIVLERARQVAAVKNNWHKS